jgi:hypothetical protein
MIESTIEDALFCEVIENDYLHGEDPS